MKYLFVSLVVCLVATNGMHAQQAATAIYADRIHTAAGRPIDNGVLVVQGGKIVAVGRAGQVRLPEGVVERRLGGRQIIPGLVDTHSHLGVYARPQVQAHSDGNEMSGPVQSGIRAMDAIFPDDPGIRMALAGGVTTANIMPGSGNVIGGQTLYVKYRGSTIEGMRLKELPVLGGLKMANGENPKGYGRRSKQAPFTRMKVASLQREQFIKAQEYQRKWQQYETGKAEGKDTARPARNVDLEPLVEVLERKRTVHFHCHRADDLMSAIRIAEEFGFELVLQHATEGYRIASILAEKKIPCSLTLVDSPGGKAETMGLLEENAAVLHKAGVLVAINTDDFITESRFFLRTGSMAVRGGMSEQAALEALTINPAKMMHLDQRLGSLESGKDADFVILSGDPFSIYTHVLETYIEGERVFNRDDRRDWCYQAGGFALPNADRLPAQPKLPELPVKVELPRGKQDPVKMGERFAVRAGRIYTAAGAPIMDGLILVEGGKIQAVGPRDAVPLPEGTPVLTAAEVTPGLIDAHSVVGLSGAVNIAADQDQDEASGPNQSDLRVLDSFNPNEPLLEFLRREGVTVIHGLPGRVNVLAGQTGIFRTSGTLVEPMTIRFPAGLHINLGEVPKGQYPGRAPLTRMATAHLVRSAFAEAQAYASKQKQSEDPAKLPPRNLKHEALVPMLEGKLPVIFSAHRGDDIQTALRLSKEFALKPMLALATEAYLLRAQLAKAKVPVLVHPTMQRSASSMETLHGCTTNAAALADAGIPLAITTAFEGYVPKTRLLRGEMAMAMTYGLGPDRALRSVTIDAAKILGIDGDYGSIEPGKVADLVLYDGDPFENATHVLRTISGGKVVYDRDAYLAMPFARRALPLTGGSGIGCCMGW